MTAHAEAHAYTSTQLASIDYSGCAVNPKFVEQQLSHTWQAST